MDMGPEDSSGAVLGTRLFAPAAASLQTSDMSPQLTMLETMSPDDMRRLLVLMGTITVISFVLVVSVISVLIAFIWYTRRRMESLNCGCKGHQAYPADTAEGRGRGSGYASPSMLESGRFRTLVPAQQHYQQSAHLQQHGQQQQNLYHASADQQLNQQQPNYYHNFAAALARQNKSSGLQQQGCSPVPGPPGGARRLGAPRGAAPDLVSAPGSVIVNPLPPSLNLPQQHIVSRHQAFVRQAEVEEEEEERVKCSEETGEDGGSIDIDEPIYMEIKPPPPSTSMIEDDDEKSLDRIKDKVEQLEEVTRNCLAEPPVPATTAGGHSKAGKKKEVEYWQITAKEVVKFRPCTETFINRE